MWLDPPNLLITVCKKKAPLFVKNSAEHSSSQNIINTTPKSVWNSMSEYENIEFLVL